MKTENRQLGIDNCEMRSQLMENIFLIICIFIHCRWDRKKVKQNSLLSQSHLKIESVVQKLPTTSVILVGKNAKAESIEKIMVISRGITQYNY